MPPVSEAQRKLMWATKNGAKTGVSKKVADDFTVADKGGHLPEHVAKAEDNDPQRVQFRRKKINGKWHTVIYTQHPEASVQTPDERRSVPRQLKTPTKFSETQVTPMEPTKQTPPSAMKHRQRSAPMEWLMQQLRQKPKEDMEKAWDITKEGDTLKYTKKLPDTSKARTIDYSKLPPVSKPPNWKMKADAKEQSDRAKKQIMLDRQNAAAPTPKVEDTTEGQWAQHKITQPKLNKNSNILNIKIPQSTFGHVGKQPGLTPSIGYGTNPNYGEMTTGVMGSRGNAKGIAEKAAHQSIPKLGKSDDKKTQAMDMIKQALKNRKVPGPGPETVHEMKNVVSTLKERAKPNDFKLKKKTHVAVDGLPGWHEVVDIKDTKKPRGHPLAGNMYKIRDKGGVVREVHQRHIRDMKHEY